MRRPLIIAHRGASAHAPENTLAAIKMAIDVGADGVEFDVRLAADGVPVVIHDPTLRRVAGRRDRIADLTSDELGRVDVGSWFNSKHPQNARPEFAAETVPTLSRVLDLLAPHDLLIYIELKCDRSSFEPLTRAVCDVAAKFPAMRFVIKSFHLHVIPLVHKFLPGMETAALFQPSLRSVFTPARIIREAERHSASQLSVHHRLVNTRLTGLAAKHGLPITVWTIDNPRWLTRAPITGIRAVITNDPGRMISG